MFLGRGGTAGVNGAGPRGASTRCAVTPRYVPDQREAGRQHDRSGRSGRTSRFGANAGQYGRRLRKLGYTGRIVSFEPTADAFEKLERAAKKDDDWWVYNVGLGRADSAQSIHVGWNTMNSLLPPSDYGKDRYLRFAKTHTEFAGAGDRVADFVGMQSEVAALRLYEGSPRMAEAIATYEGGGFEISGMYPVTREETTGRVVEFDCVMVRADAVPKE